MDELLAEAQDLIAALDAEQLLLLVAYARCLRDGAAASARVVPEIGLQDLIEEPA